MRTLLFITILFSNASSAQFKFEDFKTLRQLAGPGGWEMKMKKGVLLEQWTIAGDSTMRGISYRIIDRDSAIQETTVLEYKNGNISYSPTVRGQNDEKPVRFILVAIRNSSDYVFENKEHDYPQQIIYRPGSQTLEVITRAMDDTPDKERHFRFLRK